MDGLFSLIWVVFIVVALVNTVSGKNRKKTRSSAVPPLTAQPMNTPAQPVTQQPRPSTIREIEKWFNEPPKAEPANVKPTPAPAVAAPRVHTHLAPDCDRDDPSGSMEFVSTEGVDPCHDDDLPSRLSPRPGFPMMREQPGLTLEWTGDALVKSVIMQEVLTRPCQRRRR